MWSSRHTSRDPSELRRAPAPRAPPASPRRAGDAIAVSGLGLPTGHTARGRRVCTMTVPPLPDLPALGGDVADLPRPPPHPCGIALGSHPEVAESVGSHPPRMVLLRQRTGMIELTVDPYENGDADGYSAQWCVGGLDRLRQHDPHRGRLDQHVSGIPGADR